MEIQKQISNIDNILLEAKSPIDSRDIRAPRARAINLITRALAAIKRIAGEDSDYYRIAYAKSGFEYSSSDNEGPMHPEKNSFTILEILKGLKVDLEEGYIITLKELIHSNLFSDYLEMADYLLTSGYKDASAVIAGSTLESHLKQLSEKNGIPLLRENGQLKKAELLNQELAKAEVYSKIQQKEITHLLALRNAAAHGEYKKYSKENIQAMISNVTAFIISFPA